MIDTTRRQHIIRWCSIDPVSEQDAVKALQQAAAAGRGMRALQVNVANLYSARNEPKLQAWYKKADLLTADGRGLYWGSLLLGSRLPEATTGIGMMHRLLKECAARSERVYLLGGTVPVVRRAARVIEEEYGDIISGIHHGYFDSAEAEIVKRQIIELQPTYVLVGMSSPLKEHWIMDQAPTGITHIAVGGSLDVLAGEKWRAPGWMQRAGVEWIVRFMQEPRRLWKRYVFGNLWFASILASELSIRLWKRMTT